MSDSDSKFEQEHGFGVGSIIEYGSFGGDTRRVEVTYVDHDIKNGRPGFDGTIVGSDDGDVWGYCSQVTRVVA